MNKLKLFDRPDANKADLIYTNTDKRWINRGEIVVETAGIEPASRRRPVSDLHA